MIVPLHVWLNTDNDTVTFTIPGAEGEPDVTVLALDLKALTTAEKQRLRHVRPPDQAQRAASGQNATRGPA